MKNENAAASSVAAPEENQTRPPAPRSPGAWRRLTQTLHFLQVRLRFPLLIGLLFLIIGQWEFLSSHTRRLTRLLVGAASLEHGVSGDTEYFCPMCPGVLSSWPAKCPVCNMPLVRREKGEAALTPEGVTARMQITPYRMQLAGLRVATVEPRALAREIRALGVVRPLPEQTQRVAAPMAGVVVHALQEREWTWVEAGEVLAVLRPESSSQSASDGEEKESSPEDISVRVPKAGRLVSLTAEPGSHVSAGTTLAELVDDTRVGVESELAEQDAAMLCEGDPIEIHCQTLPGRGPWKGVVKAIEPRVSDLGRRRRVRAVVECPQKDLAAGALVEAAFSISLARTQPFSSLANVPQGKVLAVPEEAVIDTGSQQVVYVESGPGMFDGVAVKLGPLAQGYYPVVSGLEAGQRVAAAGAFLIDAETKLNPHLAAAYFGATSRPKAVPIKSEASSQVSKSDKISLAEFKMPPADQALAEKQGVCPVTKLPLGSMGKPVRIETKSGVVFLCCEGCRTRFRRSQRLSEK